MNNVDLITHQLRPSDTYRLGKVIHLDGIISRIIFSVKEFFAGGQIARDNEAFLKFYDSIRERINDLEKKKLDKNDLPDLKSLLECAAKISNSSWGRSLNGKENPFADFQERLENIRTIQALPLIDSKDQSTIARWIKADDLQRKFAAYLNLKDVPYSYKEIQPGSVLITDPYSCMAIAELKGKKTFIDMFVKYAKAFFCWMFSGARYAHVELFLGKAQVFDMAKKDGVCGQGQIKEFEEDDVFYYGTFVEPRQDVMLKAYHDYQKKFPQRLPDQVRTFDDLLVLIRNQTVKSAPEIHFSVYDIFKTIISIKRPEDYNCTASLQPKIHHYSCSATTSSIFSKFGIDIGEELQKIDQNITPSDFLRSKFFKELYTHIT